MNSRTIWLAAAFGMAVGISGAAAEGSKAHDHSGHAHAAAPAVKEFTIVGVEYQGTRMWLPGTMIVKKGETVRIKILNNIKSDPNTHGFAIDEFGVKAVVARGKPETVEFKADKEGLFTVYCHQHPAHVGGQLWVIP